MSKSEILARILVMGAILAGLAACQAAQGGPVAPVKEAPSPKRYQTVDGKVFATEEERSAYLRAAEAERERRAPGDPGPPSDELPAGASPVDRRAIEVEEALRRAAIADRQMERALDDLHRAERDLQWARQARIDSRAVSPENVAADQLRRLTPSLAERDAQTRIDRARRAAARAAARASAERRTAAFLDRADPFSPRPHRESLNKLNTLKAPGY